MWLLYFINGFNQSITGNLAPFITSEFEAHSLVPLISVVSSIMGAATYMPLAKILNLWDRWVGFALMAGFATLGLILAASCNGIGVYCASQVFYSIGFTGMTFSIDVITADTSSLKDRGLAYAFTSSHHHRVRWTGRCCQILREQLALGVRILRDHLALLRCPHGRHFELREETG
jgi:MFS family permease